MRLPSNKRTRRQHIMVIPPCTYLPVRRKILRLYKATPPLFHPDSRYIISQSTKVETQNLASPVQQTHPSSAHYGYPSLYLPPRETQNFASLQGYATIIPSRFPLYNIAVHQSRDAKSCVSRATNTPVVSTLWLSLFVLTSLVRRKILRLPCNKRTRRQHIMVIPLCTYLLVRRKILRLYKATPPLFHPNSRYIISQSTKVETQNLASPEQQTHPSSAHYGYPSLYLPPRETQNFASLQGYATIIPSRFPLYNIAVHQSRDAKSCVSRATNAPTVSTLWLSLFVLTSL